MGKNIIDLTQMSVCHATEKPIPEVQHYSNSDWGESEHHHHHQKHLGAPYHT